MRTRVAASLLALVVSVAACSSSGSAGHLLPGQGPRSATGGGSTPSTPSGGGSVAVGGAPSVAVSAPSGGGAGAAGFCGKLESAQTKLAGLSENAASDPSKLSAVIDEQIQAFKSIEDGAPAQVAPALKDLISVLTAAKGAFADPAHADPAAMSGLTANLPKDAQTLGTYIASHCGG